MLGKQQHRQHMLNGFLIVLFMGLILSLWMIRSANQSVQWYASKSQFLLNKALEVEEQIEKYAKGNGGEKPLEVTMIEVDRYLMELKNRSDNEANNDWKIKFQSRLTKLEQAWQKDKNIIERIQLSQGMGSESEKLAIELQAQVIELSRMVKMNQSFQLLDRRQSNSITQALEEFQKNLNAVALNEQALNFKLLETVERNLSPFIEAKGNRREIVDPKIAAQLVLINKGMEGLKAEFRTNSKIRQIIENYESDLFQHASRLSLLLGEKPSNPLGTTLVALLITAAIIIMLCVQNLWQRKFNDGLVAQLLSEQEETEERIKLFTHEVSNMIDGNLNVEFTVSDGPTKELAETMNMAVQSIDRMIRRVIMQIKKIQHDTMSANAMFSQTQTMFGKEDKIINAAIDNMKNVSTVLMKSSQHSDSVIAEAEQTASDATTNVNRIREGLADIIGIADKMINLREIVGRVVQNQESIQQNISAVEDATEQTVILALNAAIQAASANQGGQGFAIVATEMQELADQIEETMNDIKSQLSSVSKGLVDISASVENTTEVIEGEIVLTRETEQCLNAIEMAANQLEGVISAAAKATAVESEEAQSVINSSDQLNSGMKHLGASLSEIQAALEAISIDSNRLTDDINTFVLWEDNHAK